MSRLNLVKFRAKAPKLLAVAIVIVVAVLILLDVLEDILIEGVSLGGSLVVWPFSLLLRAILIFTQDVTLTVSSLGYVGIFGLMFLESTSLPIPSEVILPFAGYLVFLGQLNFWLIILVATIAGVAGSLIDYYIGFKGVSILERRKFLSNLFFSKGRLEAAQNLFQKYSTAVIFTRMIPGFRTLISFPAGAVRMPLAKFAAYTLLGCLLWDLILVGGGVYVGSNWAEIAGISNYLIVASIIGVLFVLGVYFLRTRTQVNRAKGLAR